VTLEGHSIRIRSNYLPDRPERAGKTTVFNPLSGILAPRRLGPLQAPASQPHALNPGRYPTNRHLSSGEGRRTAGAAAAGALGGPASPDRLDQVTSAPSWAGHHMI
jgi:hypothetical protein